MNTADLIEKYLNGSLTAAEAATLAQALAEHPSLADEFAAATRMEADIGGAFKEAAHTALYTRRMERAVEESEPDVARRRYWWRPAAAVAGLALVAGTGWAWFHTAWKEAAQKKPSGRGGGVLASMTNGGTSSQARAARAGDAAVMKRKLKKFTASSTPLRSVPVSTALAQLGEQWKQYPHRDAAEKEATFAVSDAARGLWAKPQDEPVVSLEIPGISLLTGMELIAAQAGLQAKVSGTGVSLEPDSRADDGKPHTWNLSLASTTFDTFLTRACNEMEHPQNLTAETALTGYGFGPLYMMAGAKPTWMEGSGPATFDTTVWSDLTGSRVTYNLPSTGTELAVTQHTFPDHDVSEPRTIDGLIERASAASGAQPAPTHGSVTDPSAATLQMSDTVALAEVSRLPSLATAPPSATVGFVYGEQAAEHTFAAFDASSGQALLAGDFLLTEVSPSVNWGWLMRGLSAQSPATLSRIVSAHGTGSADIQWDRETGALTAKGSLRELRAASATLAAVQESASAGISAEVKVIAWKAGTVLSKGSTVISTSQTLDLLTHADNVTSCPSVVARNGASVDVRISGDTVNAPGRNPAMKFTGRATQGFGVETTIQFDSAPEAAGGIPAPGSDSAFTASHTLDSGNRLRIDLPATNGSGALTYIIHVDRTAVPAP